MFKHPSYYKKLRASQVKKSDQAISSDNAPNMDRAHDGERERAPGPGQKLRAATHDLAEATGHKRQAIEETVPHNDIEEAQASSNKPQASSAKLLEERATSLKRQA